MINKIQGTLTPVTITEQEAEALLKSRKGGQKRWRDRTPKNGWVQQLLEDEDDKVHYVGNKPYFGDIKITEPYYNISRKREDGSISVDMVHNDRGDHWTAELKKFGPKK